MLRLASLCTVFVGGWKTVHTSSALGKISGGLMWRGQCCVKETVASKLPQTTG